MVKVTPVTRASEPASAMGSTVSWGVDACQSGPLLTLGARHTAERPGTRGAVELGRGLIGRAVAPLAAPGRAGHGLAAADGQLLLSGRARAVGRDPARHADRTP